MRTICSILLSTVLLIASGMAAADPSAPIYRVEVIVLAHLDGQSDRYRLDRAIDRSSLTDPLLEARRVAWVESRADEAAEEDEVADPDWALASETLDLDLPAAVAEAVEAAARGDAGKPSPQVLYPLTYVNLDALGREMQSAWERLERSGRHQPLSWRAWYQPLSRQVATERLRIHDDKLLQVRWFDLDRHLGRPMAEYSDPNALPLLAQVVPAAPFRLDGSLRIHQRQFIHAEIDLFWHEPLETGNGPLAPVYLPPGGFLVHRLNQSRTIRPERLEYFDSGWLGVLIRIEPWTAPNPADSPRGNRAQEE